MRAMSPTHSQTIHKAKWLHINKTSLVTPSFIQRFQLMFKDFLTVRDRRELEFQCSFEICFFTVNVLDTFLHEILSSWQFKQWELVSKHCRPFIILSCAFLWFNLFTWNTRLLMIDSSQKALCRLINAFFITTTSLPAQFLVIVS